MGLSQRKPQVEGCVTDLRPGTHCVCVCVCLCVCFFVFLLVCGCVCACMCARVRACEHACVLDFAAGYLGARSRTLDTVCVLPQAYLLHACPQQCSRDRFVCSIMFACTCLFRLASQREDLDHRAVGLHLVQLDVQHPSQRNFRCL